MFEPAPDFNADDKGCAIAAKQFYERVLHYAYQYNVFSEHRIGVINNCCSYLENLHRDNKQKIWPNGSREPMEEFQNVLLSYRLRGNPPAHETFGGKVKYLVYQVKIIMQSFYPLMLNTAKRSRTTVEALELRGYRYAAVNKSVKKIKLAALKVTYNDGLFLAISFLVVAVAVLISTLL